MTNITKLLVFGSLDMMRSAFISSLLIYVNVTLLKLNFHAILKMQPVCVLISSDMTFHLLNHRCPPSSVAVKDAFTTRTCS